MRNALLLGVLIAVAAAPVARSAESRSSVSDRDLSEMVGANNAFATELYEQLSAGRRGVFFCPFGLYSALSLTSAGVREETETQLSKALHLATPVERVHPAFAGVLKDLAADARRSGGVFEVKTALWAQQGQGLKRVFLTRAEGSYGAGLKRVDFLNAPETARRSVNTWCAKHSRGRLKTLLQDSDLAPGTQLVLTTVVYFRSGTEAAADESHAGDDNAEGSALDGEEAVLFMTKMPEGASAEGFRLKGRMGLRAALESLKISDALGESADFSGITGWKDLYMADALQRAALLVDHEGATEAVAATAIIFDTSGEGSVVLARPTGLVVPPRP
jgi:serpin B